jgi:hypothetical protein
LYFCNSDRYNDINGHIFINIHFKCAGMPACTPGHGPLDPDLPRSRPYLGNWETNFRTAGILLGLAGLAILPLITLLGLILIVSGMEYLWLASPGLV